MDIKTKKINIELDLMSWQKDGIYYLHSPLLDITGYGKNEIEARHSYNVIVSESNHFASIRFKEQYR